MAKPSEGRRHADRWAKVPAWILEVPLTRDELRALVALSAHANGDRIAAVGTPTLAAELGVHRRSARRLLAGLVAHGLAVPIGRRAANKATRYLVVPFPDGAPERAIAGGASGGATAPDPGGASSNARWRIPDHLGGASEGATNRRTEEQKAATSEPEGSPPLDSDLAALAERSVRAAYEEHRRRRRIGRATAGGDT